MEIIIVVAIISVLAAVVLTSLQHSKEQSIYKKGIEEINSIRNAMELYKNQNKVYPSEGQPTTTMSDALSALRSAGYLTTDITSIGGMDPANIAYKTTLPAYGCGDPSDSNTTYIFYVDGTSHYPGEITSMANGMNLKHLYNGEIDLHVTANQEWWCIFKNT